MDRSPGRNERRTAAARRRTLQALGTAALAAGASLGTSLLPAGPALAQTAADSPDRYAGEKAHNHAPPKEGIVVSLDNGATRGNRAKTARA